METVLVYIAIALVLLEVILLYRLHVNRGSLTAKVKWLALFAIIIVPASTLLFANYHVFESTKKSAECMSCHVMAAIGNDMKGWTEEEHSMTLAARHYRNGWLPEEQECYSCHKDYGFQGTFKAKLDGYRHLMRYVTETYEEPIRYRGEFNYMNCLGCHQNNRSFTEVEEHAPVVTNITGDNPTISCLNCHGRAHPEPSRRTPGHPEFEELKIPVKDAEALRSYLKKFDTELTKK
ncbi:hypothetical protein [Algivirga pacifica]|uniref:NapC/NirT cytochrome c N-terminal domain-containing protein n=1 Tax=Algivirga pacifica TaxID=1162670 RepID=A0ABP9DCS6_9BACT